MVKSRALWSVASIMVVSVLGGDIYFDSPGLLDDMLHMLSST